jgi:hypothetical protein
MKVLLVNPKFPDTYWSFRHALPFEGKRSVFPPLGLMTVSGLLPRDLNAAWSTGNRTLKNSQIDWADMVFITGMLAQKESLHEVVERAKERESGSCLVAIRHQHDRRAAVRRSHLPG